MNFSRAPRGLIETVLGILEVTLKGLPASVLKIISCSHFLQEN